MTKSNVFEPATKPLVMLNGLYAANPVLLLMPRLTPLSLMLRP